MSENNGFIKKFRSSKAKELKRKHTNAFLILDTLAENAKRTTIEDGHPLLELGEGIVTAEECGLSPQQFETGVKFLESQVYVEVIHRGRKDKDSKIVLRQNPESTQSSPRINSRNTPRINGTVLKLLDKDIYDLNYESTPNQLPNQISGSPRINSDKTPNKQETKKQRTKETTTPPNPPIEQVVVDAAFCFDSLENGEHSPINNSKDVDFSERTSDNTRSVEKTEINSKKTNDFCQLNEQNNSKQEQSQTNSRNPYEFSNVGDLAEKNLEEISFDGLGLTADEKNTLLRYPSNRVKFAVDYVRSGVKINRSVMAALVWHCKQDVPPISENQMKKRNEFYRDENDKTAMKFYENNRDLIKGKIYRWDREKNCLKVGSLRTCVEIPIYQDPHVFRNQLESAIYKLYENPKIESIEQISCANQL